MDDNTFTAELIDGLAQARDALFGQEHGWTIVTRKDLPEIGEAIVELSQNFSEHEMLVLGTYVAAMARQALAGA